MNAVQKILFFELNAKEHNVYTQKCLYKLFIETSTGKDLHISD